MWLKRRGQYRPQKVSLWSQDVVVNRIYIGRKIAGRDKSLKVDVYLGQKEPFEGFAQDVK